MSVELRITSAAWKQLSEHLLADRHEHATILVCGHAHAESREVLLVQQVLIAEEPGDAIATSELGISLSPTFITARSQGCPPGRWNRGVVPFASLPRPGLAIGARPAHGAGIVREGTVRSTQPGPCRLAHPRPGWFRRAGVAWIRSEGAQQTGGRW